MQIYVLYIRNSELIFELVSFVLYTFETFHKFESLITQLLTGDPTADF